MAEPAPKENSMEDILASIRKIINSDEERARSAGSRNKATANGADDSARLPTSAPNSAPTSTLTAAPATTPSGASDSTEKFGPGLGGVAQTPVSRAKSLAELSAMVNAASARLSQSASAAKGAQPSQTNGVKQDRPAQPNPALSRAATSNPAANPLKTDPASRAESLRTAAGKPAPQAPSLQAPSAQAPSAQALSTQATAPQTAGSVAPAQIPAATSQAAPAKPSANPRTIEIQAKPGKPPRTAPATASSNEALVSPSTATAVAGSVSRLKEAMANKEAAYTEAVLRPLLKEWLDNNLADMVENIVRHEIDRLTGKS